MKFFYVTLVVLLAQQVSAEPQENLKEFFNSPHWKVSLAVDAPVISPEETLGHLKELIPLLPAVKDKYSTYKYTRLETRPREGDLYMLQEDLKNLVKLSQYDSEMCGYQNMLDVFLEVDGRPSNAFGDPEKNTEFGPNMKAFIDYYREKIYQTCVTKVLEDYGKVKPRHMAVLDAFTSAALEEAKITDYRYVKQTVNAQSITNTFAKFVKSTYDGKTDDVKKQFNLVKESCAELAKATESSKVLWAYIMDRPSYAHLVKDDARKLHLKSNICRRFIDEGLKEHNIKPEDIEFAVRN